MIPDFLRNLFGSSESNEKKADDKKVEQKVLKQMSVSNPRKHTNMKRKFTGSFQINVEADEVPEVMFPESKKWSDVRKKTPSDTERLPKRGTKAVEQRYRNQLDRINREARLKLDHLTSHHDFSAMPKNKVLTEWGVSMIGSGNFRTVYGFDSDSKIPLENPEDYVLKVCSHHEEWTNEEEVKVYSRLKDTEVEEYLAPVVDFGTDYKWVLMKRAETHMDVKLDKVIQMKEECRDLGFSYGDWKQRNCGYIDGEPVLLDYGYNNEIDKGVLK